VFSVLTAGNGYGKLCAVAEKMNFTINSFLLLLGLDLALTPRGAASLY